MTIGVLEEKGQNHCEIARTLGVTEGTVRYHLRRAAQGAVDGRKRKRFKAEAVGDGCRSSSLSSSIGATS